MKRPLIVALGLALFAPLACTEQTAPTETPSTETAATGAREIAIGVKKDGYHPAEVDVAPGEEVVLVFTRTSDSRCAEKVVVPAAGIERTLPLSEPVRVAVTAPKSGRLDFACGMDMLEGALVVR
jgi:plastocyanin domain-containing protein